MILLLYDDHLHDLIEVHCIIRSHKNMLHLLQCDHQGIPHNWNIRFILPSPQGLMEADFMSVIRIGQQLIMLQNDSIVAL